jgi:hypothetical protein
MALQVAREAAPYRATIDKDVEKARAEVERHFTRLGFPDVPYPPDPARLFGADDMPLLSSEELYLAAPNAAAYTRAVEALADVKWRAPSAEEARRLPYREGRAAEERMADLLFAAAKSGMRFPGE